MCPLLVLGGCAMVAARAGAAPERPKIVVMLPDDLGFSDIGSYGAEISTANLDRLAREGCASRGSITPGAASPPAPRC